MAVAKFAAESALDDGYEMAHINEPISACSQVAYPWESDGFPRLRNRARLYSRHRQLFVTTEQLYFAGLPATTTFSIWRVSLGQSKRDGEVDVKPTQNGTRTI